LVIGILLLAALWLLRKWLAGLWWVALVLLVFLGLLFAALVLSVLLRRYCRKKQGSPKGKGSVDHPWVPSKKIPSHTYKRPDPLIYSQGYLMSKGLAVTWDNPDMFLMDGSALVPSHDLLPGKKYRVLARIWNGSTEAVAVNLLVKFYFVSFGIGGSRNFIGQTFVNVPVKGAPGLPAMAEVSWVTPATPGHYCLQAELNWPDDANPDNNLGQENVTVKKLNSPNATFTFPLTNDSPFARAMRLEADSYGIPARRPCPERESNDDDRQGRHLRSNYPVPPGWTVEINPAEVELGSGETRTVTVKITSDGAPVLRQPINVNAFAGDELAGGVTLYVHS